MISKIPYLRTGSGSSLLLVHGFLGGAEQWRREVETLSQHFDVIAPSLPGFSAANQLTACNTIQDMAATLFALMDRLNIPEFTLMGHSMGGMIAQEMAAKRPKTVKKLILYGTGPLGLMPERFEPISTTRVRLQKDGVASTIGRIAATWFVEGQAAPGYQLLTKIGALASPQAAMAALDAMSHWDGLAALQHLHMPTLIIWGDNDRSYRWPQIETLWNQIPHANLSVIPGTAHAIHLEKPKLFHETMLDYCMVSPMT